MFSKVFRAACCFFSLTVILSCHHDPSHNLFGKWTVGNAMEGNDNFSAQWEFGRQLFAASEGTYIYEADNDFFKLYADHTFTALSFGHYFLYGNWQTNKDQSKIILNCLGSSKGLVKDTVVLSITKKPKSKEMIIKSYTKYDLYQNNFFAADSLRLGARWKPIAGKAIQNTFRLQKTDSDADQDNDDVWSLADNKWRVKPARSENFEEVKKRVMASVQFAIKYINTYTGDDGFLLTPIVSPLIINGNGIEMEYFKYVDKSWKEIFYDDSEALMGYRIVETSLGMMQNYTGSKKIGVMQVNLLKTLLKNITEHATMEKVMMPASTSK